MLSCADIAFHQHSTSGYQTYSPTHSGGEIPQWELDPLKKGGSFFVGECLLEFLSPSSVVCSLQSPKGELYFNDQNTFLHQLLKQSYSFN